MASARLRRRDKQLESLVKENVKLHEDVKELEEAYQLHRTKVDEDRNSIHGLIRKETGGSRWQHGATGKLTTYKSSKDLIDDEGTSTPGRQGTSTSGRQGTSRSGTQGTSRSGRQGTSTPVGEGTNITERRILATSHRVNNESDNNARAKKRTDIESADNRRVKLVDELDTVGDDTIEDDTNQNKILDLKSKILKKVSSKIIRRDTWAGPVDVKDKVTNKKPEVTDHGRIEYKPTIKNKKKDSAKANVPNGRDIQDMNKIPTCRKQESVPNSRYNKHSADEVVTRRSRLDIHQNSIRSSVTSGQTNVNGEQETFNELPTSGRHHKVNETELQSLVMENNLRNSVQINSKMMEYNCTSDPNVTLTNTESDSMSGVNENAGLNMQIGVTNMPTHANESFDRNTNRLSHSLRNDIAKGRDVNVSSGPTHSKTFQTEVSEPTEIYIDTESGEIRVRSGDDKTIKSHANLDATKVLIQQKPVNKSIDGQRLPCTIVEDQQSLSAQQEVRDIFGLSNLDTHVQGHSDEHLKNYGSSISPFALAKDCNTEVEFWLHGLGLVDVDKYVKIFADHEIDLLDLEFMTAAQLHDMGVSAIGALDKILKGVKDLRSGTKSKSSNGNNDNRNESGQHLQLSSIAWEDGIKEKSKRVVRKSSETGLKKQGGSGKDVNNETFVHRSSDFLLTRNADVSDLRPSSAMSVHSDCGESLSSSRSKMSNGLSSFTASTKASSAKCVEKRPPSSKSATQTKGKSQQKKHGTVKRSNSSVSENKTLKSGEMEVKPTRSVLIRQRSSSLSRETTLKQPTKKEKEEKEVKGRNLRYRSRSADVVKRKAMEGVQTAAKKFEVKQQKYRDTTEPLYHKDEKMKARRNEMAARHQHREKHREFVNDQSSDTDEETARSRDHFDRDSEDGQGSLVTVNILSQSASLQNTSTASPTIIYVLPPIRPRTPSVKGPPAPSENCTVGGKPADVRKSLRRVEPARRHSSKSLAKPIDLQLNTANAKSTGRVSSRDQDKSPRSQSEPESGYKTDGSTSYAQIEDKVTEIQKKIKRLKSRASTGDLLTGTLVHDLQTQLQQFQHILGTNTNSGSSREPAGVPGTSGIVSSLDRQPEAKTPSPIEDILSEDQTMMKDFRVKDEVRMSKRELLDEMRKEKKHHHLQIRQLQQELERIKHADPVHSMEKQHSDILYKDEDMVGEGTFAQVYKGLYQGSEVAVKKLKVPLKSQDRNYFNAELSLLKELRHPRVVLLIGVCTTDKLPLMVLEYMSKGSLYNYLHDPNNECFDHAVYFQVARDIAAGMKYLHSHRPEVIHLDLKSMNVLLCQNLRAKIADFGFSKLKHDAGVKSKGKAKQTNTNLSTPAWMSPELLNKGEVTTKADVYSFAVILWEMLTRKEPYFNLSVFQILEKVRKNKRPEIPISAPDGLQLLISQCWDPNPAKRPKFKDILQILENLEFPPAWRELFKKAGVPDEALSNVQSTRDIIKLVTDTLDLPGLPNFMLTLTPKPHNRRARRSTIDSPTVSLPISARTQHSQREGIQQSQREVAQYSQREGISERDKWESETVTTLSGSEISDESDVTLRNLKEESSSDEGVLSSDSDDESCITSSDVASTVVSAKTQTVQRRPVNVFIPSLELSIESARKEFSAERNRISQSSWLSISLDDRTDRSLENQSAKMEGNSGNKKINSEISLNLMSNRSSRSSTPSAVVLTENASTTHLNNSLNDSLLNETAGSSHMNESARSRRRNKNMDLTGQSDDMLMRESFNNMRPISPKKRVSLTKKLMGKSLNLDSNSARSESSDQGSLPPTVGSISDRSTGLVRHLDNKNASEPVDRGSIPPTMSAGSSRLISNVDNSHDSFFGIPLQQNPVERTSNISTNLNTNACIDSNPYSAMLGTGLETKDLSEGVESDRRDPLRRSVYMVESEADTVSSDRSQSRTDVIDEVKKYIENKTRLSLSQSIDSCNKMPNIDKRTSLTHDRLQSEAKVKEFVEDDTRQSLSHSTGLDSETLNSDRPHSQRGKGLSTVDEVKKYKTNDTSLYLSHSGDIQSETSHLIKCESQKGDLPSSSQDYLTGRSVNDISRKSQNVDMYHSLRKEECKATDSLRESRQHMNLTNSIITAQKYDLIDTDNRLKKPNDNHAGLKSGGLEGISGTQLDKQVCLNESSSYTNSNPRPLKTNTNDTIQPAKGTKNDHKNNSTEMKQPPIKMERPVAQLDKSREVKHDGGEQIRVVLNTKDVTEKKKPVITPRKSKMKSPDINVHLSGQQPERNDNANDNLHESSDKREEINNSISTSVKQLDSNKSKNNTKELRMPSSKASVERPKRSNRQIPHASDNVETRDNTHKSNKIRVKLRKDPLAPKLMGECPSSPVPPPPPPPPPILNLSASMSTMSKSMHVEAPRLSMADELKTRLNHRQSISEGMKIVRKNAGNTSKPVKPENIIGTKQDSDSSKPVPTSTCGEPVIVQMDKSDVLAPQPSDGLPSLVVKSLDLRDQKDHLKSISKRHPDQFDDLSGASQEQLSSIADILRKAVMGRRLAMGEDGDSVTQSMESTATGWSVDFN